MPSTLICTCCERSYDSHLMVNCSVCKKFYKNTCVDITNNEVRTLNGNKGFEWTCSNCKEFGNELKDVKSMIIKLQEEIKSLKEKCITNNLTKEGFSMEEVIQELSDRNERKRNIVILGVPEQGQNLDSAVRVAKDKTEVSNILRAVTPTLAGLDVKPIRLGKPTPGKSRLIKLTLREDSKVTEVLRAAKNLKGNAAYKNISIFPDRTPMQIDNYKRLKLELEQRTANESKYFVKTKIIAADFTEGQKAVDIVKEQLGMLPINILVNNVGRNYEYPMYLTEVSEKDIQDIIAINISAVTLMCRAFIEDMHRKGRGAIVNVSSGSELQPLPLMTVYAATKAYVRSFTAALRYEYGGAGITIQHLSPLFVNTKMNAFSSKLQRKSFFVPDAEEYARYAVMTLGNMDESSGFWTHGIQKFFIKLPPVWLRTYIGARMNLAFRKDYLESKKSSNNNKGEQCHPAEMYKTLKESQ